jgi:hypothetical protein
LASRYRVPNAKWLDCLITAEVERSVSSISAQERYAVTKPKRLTSEKNRIIVTACTKISGRNTAHCAVVTMRRNGRSRSPKYALVALAVPIGQVVSAPAQQQCALKQRLHHVNSGAKAIENTMQAFVVYLQEHVGNVRTVSDELHY